MAQPYNPVSTCPPTIGPCPCPGAENQSSSSWNRDTLPVINGTDLETGNLFPDSHR